jgi:hypothetical protein
MVRSTSYVDQRGERIDPMTVVALQAQALFALRHLLVAAEEASVPVAPVKGVLTARWLYRSIAERPLSDVDVRVCDEDLGTVLALAERRRWHVRRVDPVYRALSLEIEGVAIDVETSFGARGMSSLSTRAALARAQRTSERLGVVHSMLTVHDHALLLALNVAKDRLGQCHPWAIEDLVRIAERAEFDPVKMAAVAWSAANASVLRAVSRWLARIHDSRAWGAVEVALGEVPRPLYAARVESMLGRQTRSDIERFERSLLARAACDEPLRRAQSLIVMARWAWHNARGLQRT